MEAKIYVGTYAKYNAGSLEGKWLDLSDYSDKEEFYNACKELHSDEEDPEFMFQDREGIPDGLASESWISDNLFDVLNKLNEMRETEREAFEIFLHNGNLDMAKEDIDDLYRQFEDSYCGQYKNLEDYAYELVEECYFTKDTPDIFKTYFDYEAFARDLGYEGHWEESGHVFRPC
jgi:antirestriction protein